MPRPEARSNNAVEIWWSLTASTIPLKVNTYRQIVSFILIHGSSLLRRRPESHGTRHGGHANIAIKYRGNENTKIGCFAFDRLFLDHRRP